MKEQLDRIEGKLDRLEGNFTRLDGKVGRLEAGVGELRAEQQSLRRHVGVLHEELRDDIKALPDQRTYIDGKVAAGLSSIRVKFESRLRNVELAVRKRKRA